MTARTGNAKVLLVFILFGLLLTSLSALFAASLFQSADPLDRSAYMVDIPRGISTSAVQTILEERKILRPQSNFSLAAKMLGISRSMQAGKYEFSPSDTLLEILLKLKRGKVISPLQVRITFPEGASIYKMGEILKKHSVSDPEKFQALVKEGITESVRQRHWKIFKYISSESLEGYLYPDTYLFFENATVGDMVETMLSRFEEIVMPFWDTVSGEADLTLHEILTLASIIEKEARRPEERPIISSVFHNRLRADMPLAADPTIKYALEKPTKRVYYDQLSVDSPYNTYERKGLPPGPICNPGIESIKAAVYPAKSDYYYFVAQKDGSHFFSRTLQEHERARIRVSTPTQ